MHQSSLSYGKAHSRRTAVAEANDRKAVGIRESLVAESWKGASLCRMLRSISWNSEADCEAPVSDLRQVRSNEVPEHLRSYRQSKRNTCSQRASVAQTDAILRIQVSCFGPTHRSPVVAAQIGRIRCRPVGLRLLCTGATKNDTFTLTSMAMTTSLTEKAQRKPGPAVA